MVNECVFCDEPIGKDEDCYQVMIYTKEGKQEFVKTCSHECAEETRHKSFVLHQRRADDVINCSIQRMENK